MKLKIVTIFLVSLALFGAAVFPFIASAVQLPALDVSVSSTSLMQAGTLLVVVKNEPAAVTGHLGLVMMRFSRSQNNADWISIIGIPLNKKPGNYNLVINVAGSAPFKKVIKVSKRTFPITVLTITPQLSQEGYSAKTIVNTIVNSENVKLRKVLDVVTPVAYFSKPFINPLASIKIVGPFGDIRKANGLEIQHDGVDLKALVGAPVFATNDGVVVLEQNFPDYGNTMVIDHGLGIYSLYLHLSQFNFAVGQPVKQGDTIALSGATGYVTGPHLHFGIKVRGASLDPLKFVQATGGEW